MSSPVKEELKGGHPPAVKVGGKRVVQHPHVHTDTQKKDEREAEEEEFQTEKADDAPVLVSGAVSKGDKDFTPAAVKVAHEKPHPCNEKPPQKGANNPGKMHLKQPSKNN